MRLQERIFPVAIFFVMGICCIGAYVAVSGFMIASPNGPDFTFLNAARTAVAFSPGGTLVFPTETPTVVPNTPTLAATPTRALSPTNTPPGFRPSATPQATRTPTDIPLPAPIANVTFATTRQPAAATAQPGQPAPTGQSAQQPTVAPVVSGACGFEFCPQSGAPDANLAPTHQACPSGYLWGQVYDENGNGIGGSLGWKIKVQREGGSEDTAPLKTRPDPEGIWNVTTGGGGSWTLQLVDGNNRPLSSKYSIGAGNVNGPGGSCGTRVDFKKTK